MCVYKKVIYEPYFLLLSLTLAWHIRHPHPIFFNVLYFSATYLSFVAYLFMRTKKKENIEEHVTTVTSTPTSGVSTASVIDSSTSHPVVVEPTKVREPIPVDQQRELFKWILEEKRKIKPKDPEEKKKIDEEKAILKQFIRAKSIPPL